MSDAPSTVSASELIGGEPTKKKQRPPLPPGVTVKPVRPGATWGIHPVDGLGIRLSDAKLLETPGETPPPEPSPAPPVTPDPTKPQPAPQPEAKPEPKAEETAGPAPDFSNLPPSDGPGPATGGQQQEKEPDQEQVQTAYARMAEMFFLCFVNLLSTIFGNFWLPTSPEEMKIVTGALVDYFNSIAMAAFTPLENLWLAIGMYCVPRLKPTVEKIISFWKGKNKRREQPQREPDKNSGGAPHNFSGVDVNQQPIEVESEIMSRGPGI